MPFLPEIIIIFCAFAGFLLAAYLHHKKAKPQEAFVCPLKGNCAEVIHSEFSSFFGIPVEWLGMTYYLAIALMYGLFLGLPLLLTPATLFVSIALSTAAFLFSAYLTFIQLFSLKQICTWCLTSAGLSTIIFFTSVFGSDLAFISMLDSVRPVITILHLVGIAVGLGGATVTDVFFFKFLKDRRISHEEAAILHTISQVIWFALALIVLSGAGLYLSDMEYYNQSSKFMMKMLVVSVLILNGAFLNLKITPHLVHISFGDDPRKTPEQELQRERRIAFALGAVSFVSWYSALILGALRSVPLSLPILALVYAGLLVVAIAGSQVMERRLGKQLMN